MPSFDIVSRADMQLVDNAVNITRKEIANRFDFKDVPVEFDLRKKDYMLVIATESEMKLNQIVDVLLSRSMRQGLDIKIYDLSKAPEPSGKLVRKEIPIRNGLSQEEAKKLVKYIKELGLKVQASIMDDMVRVSGKKIDDLQTVIQHCKKVPFDFALQFVNMKS
ncbi:MAG: YajQ family cyclic di-GMP-binding protein [Thermoflavifilum aggregans]|nr:YajQ family cyclic di-GMP-binding protein [Thermoflavifilum aggregans]